MTKTIKNPETIALHGGDYRSDPATTAVAVPIYQTSSYQFKDAETANKSINIIKNEILDGFDYVIKREKNKSISDKKYLTTMLPCKLINYRISKKNMDIDWNKIGKNKPNNKYKYDISFLGL